jgi:hypothetical protein
MKKISKPEQDLTQYLSSRGFVLDNDSYLPGEFSDKENTSFRAKADFYHPQFDVYVEVKQYSLNGIKCKRTADKQLEAAKSRSQFGTFHQLKNGWNHSAHKQAIVQTTLDPDRFTVLFSEEPDEATLKRIQKSGLHCFDRRRFDVWMLVAKFRYFQRLGAH